MAFLELKDIEKRFGDKTVLDGVTVNVAMGETLVLLGPSGSGKTTLLRVIAGFESPNRGEVRVGGQDVSLLPPAERNFGMVFQHYALFPHLTVAENVAFGMAARKMPREQIATRVGEMLELVELETFEGRAIHEISGGQQQRVALARALAPNPRVLLLDEPLSNLDPALRERTRRQLRDVLRQVETTAVWVTHEQQEAFDVGDNIALLDQGRLQQSGTARTLYDEARTPFVADFVGHASWLDGEALMEGLVGAEVEVAPGVRWQVTAGVGCESARAIRVMARPEDLQLIAPDGSVLEGRIGHLRFTGQVTHVEVVTERGGSVVVAVSDSSHLEVGQRVGVVPIGGRPSPRAFAADAP